MGRPTMDEMRERDRAAREALEPKQWLVEVDIDVTYNKTFEVEAANKEEAKDAAREEAECADWEDFDEPYIDSPSIISVEPVLASKDSE